MRTDSKKEVDSEERVLVGVNKFDEKSQGKQKSFTNR